MTALNKLLKRPRAAAGIWRATDAASWSSESMTWIEREEFDDTGAERCSITFHFQPATKEGSFWWERGMDYQGCLGWGLHFWGILPTCWDILVQHFLPMDFLAGIALLRVCGCRVGMCVNPRGGCNQMRIRLCCLCISGATFLIESICSVILHQAFDYTYYPTSLGKCWVPF